MKKMEEFTLENAERIPKIGILDAIDDLNIIASQHNLTLNRAKELKKLFKFIQQKTTQENLKTKRLCLSWGIRLGIVKNETTNPNTKILIC